MRSVETAAYTLPDWLAIFGFPLALLGIAVGIAQLQSTSNNASASKAAAESAREAALAAQKSIEQTERNLAENHLLMLLLQLEGLIKELGATAAVARSITTGDAAAFALIADCGRQVLDEWIRAASQLQMFLDSAVAEEASLIDTLDASATVAGQAKDQLLQGGSFDDASKELREMTTLVEIGCAKVLGKMRAFLREGPSQ